MIFFFLNEFFQLHYKNLNNRTYQCIIEADSTSALLEYRRGLLGLAIVDESVEQVLHEHRV